MKTQFPLNSMISILVVDDHPLFRLGVRAALKTIPYVKTVAEAVNGQNALDILKTSKFDVIFMDLRMPVMDGVETVQICKKTDPEIKIIGISMNEDVEFVLQMIEAGASGYLLKSAGRNEMEQAIRAVLNGNNYFSSEVACTLATKIKKEFTSIHKHETVDTLSKDRFRDIIFLICNEHTSVEIANKLFLSSRTVEYYRKRIFEISRAKNMVGVMKFALKHRILEDRGLIQKWGKS